MTIKEKQRAIDLLANNGMTFEMVATMLEVMYTDCNIFVVDVLEQLISESTLNLTEKTIILKSLKKAIASIEG